MNKKGKLEFASRVVERLIMQYQEYLTLSDKIRTLETERFACVAKVSKEQGIGVQEVLAAVAEYDEVSSIDKQIDLHKTDLERLSAEMSFAGPVIWMMYKYKAYKGTSTEIATLGDLRKHCEPEGYICTVRFRFLNKYLDDSLGVDLADLEKYPDQMSLENFYTSDEIMCLEDDPEFMKEWKREEYQIVDGHINKWGTRNS